MRTLALAALLAACRHAPPEVAGAERLVTFDTPAHDVWALEAWVSGSADPRCAAVDVVGPRGAVPARLDAARFRARVPLAEGDNTLVAQCRTDRARAASEPLLLRVPLDDPPLAAPRVTVADGVLRLDAGASTPSASRPAPIVSWRWSEPPGNPAPLRTGDGPELILATPAADGEYTVALEVTDADGRTDRAEASFEVRGGEPRPPDLEDAPAWVDDAVIYGVVPMLFGPGGGLADVAVRLDAIEALGADTLWLSPVFAAPEDDFGYAVRDPFAVREAFGGEDALRALVDAAHARGMRVILDFVANHTSDTHPYYVAGAPYGDWYEQGDAASYFGWTHLPNLDYDNPEVQTYVLAASERWVRDLDVDGYRVDVAWGVQRRAPEFWPRWRAALKRIEPDLLLLAEGTARDPWWFGHGFDAAYDWTDGLGQWAWQEAFDDPEHTAARLREAFAAEAPGGRVFRFLENNDTGERFVTRYGRDVTALAATLLLTLDGLPLVYTGQEIGAAYEPYDEGPPVDWSADPHGLREVYAARIALRRALPALTSARTTHFEVHPDVVSYVRHGDDPADDALVLLNFSDEPVDVRVPAARVPGMAGAAVLRDHLAGEAVPARADGIAARLGPHGARVITRR